MHLLNHYLQEIIRSLRAVILLPFPDMIKTSLSLERTYLQALNSLLSSRSPLSLAPLSSSTSQVALMTLKQFKLSDCKHQLQAAIIQHRKKMASFIAWDKQSTNITGQRCHQRESHSVCFLPCLVMECQGRQVPFLEKHSWVSKRKRCGW